MNHDVLPSLDEQIYYRPSAYYFRVGLRNAKTKAEAVEVGLVAVRELECLKEWVRSQGLIPPRWWALNAEADAKELEEEQG